MATYKPSTLESSASTLHSRAVAAVISRALVAVGLYLLWHWTTGVITEYAHAFLTVVSLGKVRFATVVQQNDTIGYIGSWAIIGACFGLGKAQDLMVEAQKVLCAVEQEKHLRFIAQKVGMSDGRSGAITE